MEKGFVIAIDGPAAAGKGTIVQMLTKYLDGINIYTGGMYRALGLKCLRKNISLDDKEKIIEIMNNSDINLGSGDNLGIVANVYLDGENVTEGIKTPDVGIAAGKTVLIEEVRNAMVRRQRELADRFINVGKTVILDGQDTALIYPDAKIKIFLTASQEARAKRRQKQYERQGIAKTLENVLSEIKERDTRDFSRNVHPLSKDPLNDGYFVLDSTDLNEEETFNIIKEELFKRGFINDKN